MVWRKIDPMDGDPEAPAHSSIGLGETRNGAQAGHMGLSRWSVAARAIDRSARSDIRYDVRQQTLFERLAADIGRGVGDGLQLV